MRMRKVCRYLCFASGALFLLTPALVLLGLIKAAFPNGEWLLLDPIKILFGGCEQVTNEGNLYTFAYRLNPFYIALISVCFVAGLASFFGLDCRKNLIFSLIAGFFALALSSLGVVTFHWMNPGFPLDGIRGGTGFILSVFSASLGIILLIPSILFAQKKK